MLIKILGLQGKVPNSRF